MKKEKELRICTIGAIALTIVLVVLYIVLTDATYAVAETEYKHIVDGAMPVINLLFAGTILLGGFTSGFFVYLNLIKTYKKNPEELV